MKFEAYFSFEAIVGDLVKWRIAGKDVGGTLPPRKMWSRAGVKERKGVAPDVVRRQAIWRTVRRACGDVGECCQLPIAPATGGTLRPTDAARRDASPYRIAVGAEFDEVGGGGARGGVFGEGGV